LAFIRCFFTYINPTSLTLLCSANSHACTHHHHHNHPPPPNHHHHHPLTTTTTTTTTHSPPPRPLQVSSTSATEAEKRREAKRQEELRRKEEQASAAAAQADVDDGFQEIGKQGKKKKDRSKISFGKDEEITHELVQRTLISIVSQRGKKGTKISDQQKMLRQLRLIANNNGLGEGVDAVISLQIINSHFDNVKSVSAVMDDASWRTAHDDMIELVALLDRTPHMRVGADIPEDEEVIDCTGMADKQCVYPPPPTTTHTHKQQQQQ
jgi:hypothetical protein